MRQSPSSPLVPIGPFSLAARLLSAKYLACPQRSASNGPAGPTFSSWLPQGLSIRQHWLQRSGPTVAAGIACRPIGAQRTPAAPFPVLDERLLSSSAFDWFRRLA